MTNASSIVKTNYTIIAGIAYVLIILLALIPGAIFDIGSLLKAEKASCKLVV